MTNHRTTLDDRRNSAALEDAPQPLVTVKQEPFNAEAPMHALGEQCTPTRSFYVRSHFALPALSPDRWRLRVEGALAQPFELTLDVLRAMPARDIAATLECAGNDRIGLAPLPPGEPWGSGAVSTGHWRGVPLRDVITRAGLHDSVVELLFEGADRGRPDGHQEDLPFGRALPLDKALDPDTLLVYELNGEPLSPEHGSPVRLLVPDWYGVASVKWLARIVALEQPFAGYFQTERYVLERPGQAEKEQLRAMRVKSLITSPVSRAVLEPGLHRVTGLAWSGAGAIAQVEICTSAHGDWQPAQLIGPARRHAWQQWTFDWEVTRPGRHTLRARATDEQGNIQPDAVEWNRLGYANNAIQLVAVEIRDWEWYPNL